MIMDVRLMDNDLFELIQMGHVITKPVNNDILT